VLTGSARVAQEAKESAAAAVRRQEIERKQRELERKRKALQAQIAALHAAYEVESQELEIGLAEERLREEKMAAGRIEMARLRKAEVGNGKERGKNNRKGAPA
jgi:circadian clock protein KaiC